MKIIEVTAKTEYPLLIARESTTDYFYPCLDYMTGTAIRGAFAYIYLNRNNNNADEVFKKYFLNSAYVKWGGLYYQGSLPLPLTARTCKITPGFASSGHGVLDTLFHLISEEKSGRFDIIPDDCSCGAAYDRAPFEFFNQTNNGFAVALPKKRITSKVAIDRETESSRAGALYSYEMLNEGQTFAGNILVSDDIANELKIFISSVTAIRLGRGRTRGLGKVSVSFSAPAEYNSASANKYEDFNKKLYEFANTKGVKLDANKYFSILLLSDSVLEKSPKEYFQAVTSEYLKDNYGINCKLVAGESNKRIISGWDYQNNRPKDNALAITKGSVFAFEVQDENGVAEKLKKIEENGIGERREEGFGRISVCDPFHFHWEVRNA